MILLDMAHEYGLSPRWVAGTDGDEYHSPCPKCGGEDRFVIQPNKPMKNCIGRYSCPRGCEIYGDAIQFAREFLGLEFEQAVERARGTLPTRSFIKPYKKPIRNAVYITQTSPQWEEKAKLLVDLSNENLLQKLEIIEQLKKRGIPLEAIKKYKLGWNPYTLKHKRVDWGLNTEGLDANGNKIEKPWLWLPKGIVIPTIEPSGKIIRLKIRRADYVEGDTFGKYQAVSGSSTGLNLLGNKKSDVAIVVESELDLIALSFMFDDQVLIVAVGSNLKKPDVVTDLLVKRCKTLLISHDNDEAGLKMLEKWQNLYPHAQACSVPIYKDVGEAIKMGIDIREWLLGKIPIAFHPIDVNAAQEQNLAEPAIDDIMPDLEHKEPTKQEAQNEGFATLSFNPNTCLVCKVPLKGTIYGDDQICDWDCKVKFDQIHRMQKIIEKNL